MFCCVVISPALPISFHPKTAQKHTAASLQARPGRFAALIQAQVAQRLKRPQSFVSKYESGERQLDVVEFVAVCKALGVLPAEVMAVLH
jgi:Helix-turn-helix